VWILDRNVFVFCSEANFMETSGKVFLFQCISVAIQCFNSVLCSIF